jgi:hypothetical protein
MNNTRLQRILTSGSLVTQAFGFSTLGSLMTLRGWSDSGARIAGLLAVLTGIMFFVAAIAYWFVCRRRMGERLGVPGMSSIPSNAAALAGLERRPSRRTHHARYPHRLLPMLEESCSQGRRTLQATPLQA